MRTPDEMHERKNNPKISLEQSIQKIREIERKFDEAPVE
jgi:hypothetical protein